MKTINSFNQKLLALALLAAFNPAYADSASEVKDLTTPDSSISIGLGGTDGDSKEKAQFGQYNGMRKDSGYLLFDVDYLRRADETGTWTKLQGRNLGLDNRELMFGQQKQGDWKYAAEYNEITRTNPYNINTAMGGVGSANQTVVRLATPGTGTDYNLKTDRKSVTVSGEKWFSPNLQFEASFKNEEKTGSRLWGRGYDCAGYVCGSAGSLTAAQTTAYALANVKNVLLLMPEPINSSTKQFEAKFNFHDEKLFVSGAYYGTFYTNSNGSIVQSVPNILNNGIGLPGPLYPVTPNTVIGFTPLSLQNVLQLPVALPPDNQAHQFSLSGNYAFTPTTKATFKYAYSQLTQDDSFASQGLSGAPGTTNLGGRVDSTLAQFGLTSKPMPKLTLLANVRYENKEDKTPSALYNAEGVTLTPAVAGVSNAVYTNVGAYWNNNHVTSSKVNGKLEASYQLPNNYRATLAVDYEGKEREVPTDITEEKVAGINVLRASNKETGYRIELRKNMSETLTGALSLSSSKRSGSDWTSLGTSAAYIAYRAYYGSTVPASVLNQVSATVVYPASMADLQRDKVRLNANWNATDKLTFQFMAEDIKDSNETPSNPLGGQRGRASGKQSTYSVDASYAVSDKWKLTGYATQYSQSQVVDSSGNWTTLDNKNEAFHLSLVGQPSGRLQVGGTLGYMNETNKYGIIAPVTITGTPPAPFVVVQPTAANLAQAARGVPDVVFRTDTLNLFGKYALEKYADLRVDLIHQRTKFDDWVWGYNGVPFTFADNSTVQQKVDQSVTFVGVTYIYKWK